jgi:hydrogenase maturation factor
MLLNINRLDEERAAQAIEKLKKVIEDREDGQSAAA